MPTQARCYWCGFTITPSAWQCLIFLVPFSVSFVRAAEPYLLIVDPDRTAETESILTSLSKFEVLESLNDSQLAALSQPNYYQLSNAEGFASQTGLAYFMSDSGKMNSCRFWTVSGEDVFEKFVAWLVEARGGTAVVTGDRFQKQVSVTRSKPVPGKVNISWNDIFVSYTDGVVFLGENTVFTLTNGKLTEVVEAAKGKSSYLWASPDSVPLALRTALVTEIEKHTGVQLQRKDNEKSEKYATRRAMLEGYFRTIGWLLLEVEEITAWTRLPSDSAPFQSRLSLKSRPKSSLANMLESLRNERSIEMEPTPSAIGSAVVSLQIPLEARSFLSAGVSELIPGESPLLTMVLERLRDGRYEMVAEVIESAEGIPVVEGATRIHAGEISSEQFAAGIDAATDSNGLVTKSVTLGISGVSLSQQQLSVAMSDGLLNFAMADPSVTPRLNRLEFRDKRERGRLVEIRLDLGNIANKTDGDAQVMKLIADLELAYHRWHVLSTIPPSFQQQLASKLTPISVNATFRSFASKISDNGNWNLELSVDTDGESLTIQCDAGLDAFQFGLAHRYMANVAVMQLIK